MAEPQADSGILRARFRRSLAVIVITIGVAEAAVMMLLDICRSAGLQISPLQEAIADAALLAAVSFPIIWQTSLRPLVKEVQAEAGRAETLGRTNAELRLALDAHALVAIVNVAGNIVQVNDRFCDASGHPREKLIGKTLSLLNSGYHDENFFRQIRETVKGGKIWNGEICNRRRNGSRYWVHSTVVPLLAADGTPSQYITIDRDITSQKTAEAKLLALYRAVEASSDMVLITQANGSIQYTNPALSAFTGWPIDSLIGKSADVLQSPHADASILADMKSALSKGSSWSGRLLLRRLQSARSDSAPDADSREYWANISITPIHDTESRLTGYVQIQQDATRQVAAEAALLSEKEAAGIRLAVGESLQSSLPLAERFGQVLETLAASRLFNVLPNSGVYLRQQDKDAASWHAVARYRPDTEQISDLLWLESSWKNRGDTSDIVSVVDGGELELREGRYVAPLQANGECLGKLILLTDAIPSRSPHGLNLLQRIGEKMALALLQERAKLSLEAARDAALQATLTKSRFLANMSHEIRTPMNGVLGMLDLLRDTELSSGQWDLVDTAYASAEALLEIINDILDFSKIEAGRVDLESIRFDLPELIEDVCHLMSGRAHAKNLELNCLIPPGFKRLWMGDPTRIRQIVTNLIGNAIKFTEAGEISVGLSEQIMSNGGRLVTMDVRDTGIGIAEDVRASLFQPFAQADSTTARRFGGTGLGLTICKELVERMGGTLGLDSEPGKGSRFWFTLSLMPCSEQTADTPKPFTDIQGLVAWVVAGHSTNRTILRHNLESWGMLVWELPNGASALGELATAQAMDALPNLIIADIDESVGSDIEIGDAIAEDARWRDIPLITLTSGAPAAERPSVDRAPVCLLKPIRQHHLYEAVTTVLGVTDPGRAESQRSPRRLADFGRFRVLIAEDNPVNRKVIIAMLAKFGVVADVTENGREALAAATARPYDLILMDCQMPVMDGYEATRLLRQKQAETGAGSQPIVAVTANSSEEERQQCLNAGMDDHLPKPITQDRLAAMLRKWLCQESETSNSPDASDVMEPGGAMQQVEMQVWNSDLALNQLGGDRELMLEMIGLYHETAAEKLHDLRTSWEQLDFEKLKRAAHSLKGLAGHFCADGMRELAARLERAASENNHDECANLIDPAQQSAGLLDDALTRYRDQQQHG